MLVTSNSRQTLGFFGYLEDLKSSSKLLPAGKAQEYCFPSRECQEITNTAEKSSVSPKSHSTYTFNTKKLTWEVLLRGTETSIMTPCPQTKHQIINLKEDFVKSQRVLFWLCLLVFVHWSFQHHLQTSNHLFPPSALWLARAQTAFW